jgi:kynurenine formamidase
MSDLPSYSSLPAKAGNPPGSTWGLWGDDDQLGCVNLITPERIAGAGKLIRTGEVFALNLRVDLPDPPLYGRGAVKHTITGEGGNGRDDYLDNFWPQASSQWDSLRHIRHPEFGWYNGVADDQIIAGDAGKLGIENMARHGIAGRGVLLDVGRYLQEQGRPLDYLTATGITVADVEACRASQRVELSAGDVLLFHTGWLQWYRTQTTAEQRTAMADRNTLQAPGLAATEDTAAYLWDHGVAAVAADNPALEAWPPRNATGGFLHHRLIPMLGMPIGELWWLHDLAEACAADGRYGFFLASAPLNVPGGVGSPPNALAIR